MTISRLTFLILIGLLASLSCHKDKSPTGPSDRNPIPLKVGNFWVYGDPKFSYPDFRTELKIESVTTVDANAAYVVRYDVYTSLGRLITIDFAWQWRDPYLYEYEKSYGTWNHRKCFNCYAGISDSTDWGYYVTRLVSSDFACGNFRGCLKYVSTNKTNGKDFTEAIKDGVGFVMLSDDVLKSYLLPKIRDDRTRDFLRRPKTLIDYHLN